MEDRRRPARDAARLELLRAAELWFWRMSQKHDIRNWDLVEEWNSLRTFAKIRRFMIEVRAGHPFAVEQYQATSQCVADLDAAEIPPQCTTTGQTAYASRKAAARLERARTVRRERASA